MDEAGTRAGELYGMKVIMAGTAYWESAEGADAGSTQ